MICEFSAFPGNFCGNETNDDLCFAPVTLEQSMWIYLCHQHRDHYWPDGVPEDCLDAGYDEDEEEEFEDESILEGIDDENPYV